MEWKQDYTALIVSYVYVFGIIGLGEFFRRVGRRPLEFTRKFIHVGIGMWSLGTILLFETWQFAIIPPITFVIINAVSYFLGTFQAMESGQKGDLGTIYFPISFGAIVYFFWQEPILVVAALMPMTWGDAMAAIVGRRYGHYQFTIGGRTRTLEGSAAMLLWSWLTTFAALLALPYLLNQTGTNWLLALIYSGAVAVVAAVVEALSPWGIDNLTVPAASVAMLSMLIG